VLKRILPEGAIRSTGSYFTITGAVIKAIVKNQDKNQLDQLGLKDFNETIVKSNSLSDSEKNELEYLINQEQLNLKNKEEYFKTRIKEEIDKFNK
jgi:hypothetical protein